MNEVIFDIETTGDIKDQAHMRITVVSLYEYATDAYRSFEEHELSQLWPIFEQADRLIGYNTESFDIPILNRYYAGDLMRIAQLDILKVIRKASGKRFKLNDIAKATIQTEKSSDGLEAMKWFAAGEIEKVKEYCEQDVRVTRGVYEFGKKNKMIYYPTLTGEVMPIPVDFESKKGSAAAVETRSGINLTLPF